MKTNSTAALLAACLACIGLMPGLASAGGQCSQSAETCIREIRDRLESRGWIGIEWEAESGEIPVITRVVPGGPAEAAGLLAGDAVIAVNGLETREGKKAIAAELDRILKPGREIVMTVERQGDRVEIRVMLAEIPEALLAQWIGHHMLEGHAGPVEEAAPAAP